MNEKNFMDDEYFIKKRRYYLGSFDSAHHPNVDESGNKKQILGPDGEVIHTVGAVKFGFHPPEDK